MKAIHVRPVGPMRIEVSNGGCGTRSQQNAPFGYGGGGDGDGGGGEGEDEGGGDGDGGGGEGEDEGAAWQAGSR
jgi:hypothetical protein